MCDEESETLLAAGGGKVLKSSRTHLWLVFKPSFLAQGVVIN